MQKQVYCFHKTDSAHDYGRFTVLIKKKVYFVYFFFDVEGGVNERKFNNRLSHCFDQQNLFPFKSFWNFSKKEGWL